MNFYSGKFYLFLSALVLITFNPSSEACAENIYLKSGKFIEGTVIGGSSTHTEVDLGEGLSLTLPNHKIFKTGEAADEALPALDSMSDSLLQDDKLISWIKNQVSPHTGMPLSFYIPSDMRKEVYKKTGKPQTVQGVIERNIVEEGLEIYDGALWQIVMMELGGEEYLERASLPTRVYWEGRLGDLTHIRAGFPGQPFVYDPDQPKIISSDLTDKGERGFIFRIINAHGKYTMSDPLDGKTELEDFPNSSFIHWEDWKPIAGENAWQVLAALRLYHKKYYNASLRRYVGGGDAVELKLSEEIARAAIILQAENGGIRMAPMGTYHNFDIDNEGNPLENGVGKVQLACVIETADENLLMPGPPVIPKDFGLPSVCTWHYYEISTENTLSWYAAFRMLYQITQKKEYERAFLKIEDYFKAVWNSEEGIFYQGMHYSDGWWLPNKEFFATDVQNWAIAAIGPNKIDQWFTEGAGFRLWQQTKAWSGFINEKGVLEGVGYTRENDRLSVEWTCGAILAARLLADYYKDSHPAWSDEASRDAVSMRAGIEKLRSPVGENQAAYSYSSRRGWIPFGWFSHSPEVLSLASSTWVYLVDRKINPFYLPHN